MTAQARLDSYEWAGGREAMLRFGPDEGPVVVALLPLFEEANRTRAFVVTMLRALAKRGIASILPDLPGMGESVVSIAHLTRLQIAEGPEALTDSLLSAGRRSYGLSVRSGTLLDFGALHSGRWHLSPMEGQELLRDLHRTWLASETRPAHARSLDAMMYGEDDPVTIAGTAVSADLLSGFSAATPFAQDGVPRRVVRIAGDPRPADRHVPGRPLWRAAEPANDPALAALLADDITDWIAQCEG